MLKNNNRQTISFIVNFVAAIFTTVVFTSINIINDKTILPTNTVFTIFLAIALYFLYRAAWHKIDLRILYTSAISAFILACAQKIGADFVVVSTSSENVKLSQFIIAIIALTLFFQASIVLFIRYSDNITNKFDVVISDYIKKIRIKSNIIQWFFILFIILAWIPAILAVYPGNFSYDATPQVLQLYQQHQLSAHHPVIHTLMLDGLLGLGHLIGNDYNTGLLIYIIAQMLMCAFSFGYVLYKLLKLGHSKILVFVGLIFISFNPIIQIWVVTTTKDVPFSAFFVLFIFMTYELLLDHNTFYANKYKMSWFIIVGILVCLFRNQGIYVIILNAIFIIIYLKKARMKTLIIFLSIIIPSWLFLGPLEGVLGIQPGDAREMYSVPMQQIARVYNYNPSSINPSQKKVIESVIPEEYLRQYIPIVSDPVKSGFSTATFDKEKNKFLKVWLELGLKNKKQYTISFLWGSFGYFYTDYTPFWIHYIMYDGAHISGSESYLNILHIRRDSKFHWYDTYLRGVSEKLTTNSIPILSTLLNEAAPFWIFIICSAISIYKKRYPVFLASFYVFIFWGTNLLGPVISVRYAFPLIVTIPFMLVTISNKKT